MRLGLALFVAGLVTFLGRSDAPPTGGTRLQRVHTQWVLLTSGTMGVLKMVVRDFASLTAPMQSASPADGADVWGTFHDIRRFGGLQIYLRAVCGGASLVLSSAGKPVVEHLDRVKEHKVSHPFRHAVTMAPCDDDADVWCARSTSPAAFRRDCRLDGP